MGADFPPRFWLLALHAWPRGPKRAPGAFASPSWRDETSNHEARPLSPFGSAAHQICTAARRRFIVLAISGEERGRPMEGNHSAAQDPESRLAVLRTEHRDLDSAIDALRTMTASDDIQLARLKKRKLRLKEEIAQLEDMVIPDIIA